ncbi:hypothetical protein PCE1_003894 [Barthelona sp. PCE]
MNSIGGNRGGGRSKNSSKSRSNNKNRNNKDRRSKGNSGGKDRRQNQGGSRQGANAPRVVTDDLETAVTCISYDPSDHSNCLMCLKSGEAALFNGKQLKQMPFKGKRIGSTDDFPTSCTMISTLEDFDKGFGVFGLTSGELVSVDISDGTFMKQQVHEDMISSIQSCIYNGETCIFTASHDGRIGFWSFGGDEWQPVFDDDGPVYLEPDFPVYCMELLMDSNSGELQYLICAGQGCGCTVFNESFDSLDVELDLQVQPTAMSCFFYQGMPAFAVADLKGNFNVVVLDDDEPYVGKHKHDSRRNAKSFPIASVCGMCGTDNDVGSIVTVCGPQMKTTQFYYEEGSVEFKDGPIAHLSVDETKVFGQVMRTQHYNMIDKRTKFIYAILSVCPRDSYSKALRDLRSDRDVDLSDQPHAIMSARLSL